MDTTDTSKLMEPWLECAKELQQANRLPKAFEYLETGIPCLDYEAAPLLQPYRVITVGSNSNSLLEAFLGIGVLSNVPRRGDLSFRITTSKGTYNSLLANYACRKMYQDSKGTCLLSPQDILSTNNNSNATRVSIETARKEMDAFSSICDTNSNVKEVIDGCTDKKFKMHVWLIDKEYVKNYNKMSVLEMYKQLQQFVKNTGALVIIFDLCNIAAVEKKKQMRPLGMMDIRDGWYAAAFSKDCIMIESASETNQNLGYVSRLKGRMKFKGVPVDFSCASNEFVQL